MTFITRRQNHEKTMQQRRVAIMSHRERLNRYVFSFDLNAASDIIFAQGWWEIVPHRRWSAHNGEFQP